MSIPNVGDIKTALTALSDLVKKGMTVEAQEKIMSLREMLLELREQNIEYRETIEQLEKTATIEKRLVFDKNILWEESDGERIGPYCQPCWDSKKRLIRLQKDSHYHLCKVCGDKVQHTKFPTQTIIRRSW